MGLEGPRGREGGSAVCGQTTSAEREVWRVYVREREYSFKLVVQW